jgi:hypothetical protein
MPYCYEDLKPSILTDKGQRTLLKVRDRVQNHMKHAKLITMDEATSEILGDTWEQMAYVDRLVEIGELKEVPQGDCAGQHRIFYVPGNR